MNGINKSYDEMARGLQSALTRAAPEFTFRVKQTLDFLMENDPAYAEYTQSLFMVRAQRDNYAYEVPVSRTLLEYEDAITVARMMVPLIRHEFGRHDR